MTSNGNIKLATEKLNGVLLALSAPLKQYAMLLPPAVKNAVKDLQEVLRLLKAELGDEDNSNGT